MPYFTIDRMFGLCAIATVGLSLACGSREPRSEARGRDTSSARNTETLGTAIEGVYTAAHTVSTADGPAAAEDVVEIVAYDPTHVFLRIVAHFDNGHSCSLYGIAALEDQSFVYRTRQPVMNNEPTCTLKVATTQDELRITDRLEPNGTSTCLAFCGARGNLSDFATSRKHRRPIQDMTRVTSSVEFAAAVEEFNIQTAAR
jgi:hypothetical protein